LPAKDDSRDGDYKYEELSQYSIEDVEWGSEQEWERATRRYEEVEELVRRYIAWEDRQQKQKGRKVEYLLKLRAILDTRKRASVSAVEVYEEGIGRDFMDIKKPVKG
jgi:oligoribonuclease NrnB/cAMP/cGMP phosphodiesterase (DHH superfamily)